MWVGTKPRKGAFANRTVNCSTQVVGEGEECENEWLVVIGNGSGGSPALDVS